MFYYFKENEMFKHFMSTFVSVGSMGISLATIGSIVSLIAAIFSIVYTGMKIYDWIKKKIG